MKETDLAKPIADWLRSKGYVVYAEIPCLGRCVDFIGLRNDEIVCVELKCSLTTKRPKKARHFTSPVLYQARTCQIITPIVYVAVATKPRFSSIEACKEVGVGILRVCSEGEVIEIIPPHKRCEPLTYCQEEIKTQCISLGPSDDAGKPQQLGEGPAQEVAVRIREYANKHPEAGWQEIFNNVPNHYSNYKSMSCAMTGYLRLSLQILRS